MLRYAPAAARRAAGLGARREAAAQYERALRFAAGQDPATVAALYDSFAYEAGLLDRWQEAADAGERALGLWRQLDDRLREGETLRWLAGALCSLSRGSEGVAAAEAAIALLRAARRQPRAGLGLRQPGRAADGAQPDTRPSSWPAWRRPSPARSA